MSREVTEKDLRAPEFRQGGPEEYEFRDDGKIVRKDRFKCGMQSIAAIIFGARYEYEIPEVVAAVHKLKGIQLAEAIENARGVFEGEPEALKCLDYLQEVIRCTRGST
jgi:hypothetical protein